MPGLSAAIKIFGSILTLMSSVISSFGSLTVEALKRDKEGPIKSITLNSYRRGAIHERG